MGNLLILVFDWEAKEQIIMVDLTGFAYAV